MKARVLIVALVLCGCQNLEPRPGEPVVVDFPVIDADGEWTSIKLEPGTPGKPVEVE